MFWKVSGWSGKLLGGLKSSHIVWNVSGWYGKFQDGQESFWRVLKYLRWFWYFPDGLQSFQVVWKMSECIGKFCGWYCKFSDCLVVRKVSKGSPNTPNSFSELSGKLLGGLECFQIVWKVAGWYGKFWYGLESFCIVWRVLDDLEKCLDGIDPKVAGWYWKFLDGLESFWIV